MIKNKYQPSKLMKLSGKFGINRKQITTYAKFFPDLVMRNLIESEIIYDIA